MFRHSFALFAAAAMVILAAVAPASAQSCNGGSVHCCNSVSQSNADSKTILDHLVGADVGEVTGLVGVQCSPVTAIGASGTSCSAQTVCCNQSYFNGVVASGCTPINLGA